MILSHKASATTFAVWFLVGTAIANLVRWSVMTNTSLVPFPSGSIDRKSIQTNLRGEDTLIDDIGAFHCGDVLLMYLSQVWHLSSTLWDINGRKKSLSGQTKSSLYTQNVQRHHEHPVKTSHGDLTESPVAANPNPFHLLSWVHI